VKALPAVTNELELELTTACRLGPLLCFPKKKEKYSNSYHEYILLTMGQVPKVF
jgi:hypothetical protein